MNSVATAVGPSSLDPAENLDRVERLLRQPHLDMFMSPTHPRAHAGDASPRIPVGRAGIPHRPGISEWDMPVMCRSRHPRTSTPE
jgi:hypothetical protein